MRISPRLKRNYLSCFQLYQSSP